MATPITMMRSNVIKFVRWEISEIVRYLHDKKNKISAPYQTVSTAQIAPKICQGQTPAFGSHCSIFHPNLFTFGVVIAECVKTVFWPRRVFPRFTSKALEANNNISSKENSLIKRKE